MVSLLLVLSAALVVSASVAWYAKEGFRNGDRPDDALVRAALRPSGQPGEPRPVAVVTVRNLEGAPVLAALGVRRAVLPGWLAGTLTVGVARRTARRSFLADGFPAVGVVPGGSWAELAAPVPAAARGYLLTVVVGQRNGRLRVHRLRLDASAARRLGQRDTLRLPGWARD